MQGVDDGSYCSFMLLMVRTMHDTGKQKAKNHGADKVYPTINLFLVHMLSSSALHPTTPTISKAPAQASWFEDFRLERNTAPHPCGGL